MAELLFTVMSRCHTLCECVRVAMCIIIIVSKQNKKKVNIPSSGGNCTVQCAGVCQMQWW